MAAYKLQVKDQWRKDSGDNLSSEIRWGRNIFGADCVWISVRGLSGTLWCSRGENRRPDAPVYATPQSWTPRRSSLPFAVQAIQGVCANRRSDPRRRDRLAIIIIGTKIGTTVTLGAPAQHATALHWRRLVCRAVYPRVAACLHGTLEVYTAVYHRHPQLAIRMSTLAFDNRNKSTCSN